MTRNELIEQLKLVAANFSKTIDETLLSLWMNMFIHFDANMFKLACIKIMAENTYFPNTKDIIQAYKDIKFEIDREAKERAIRNQNMLQEGHLDCELCNNTGWCQYTVRNEEANTSYDYVARCICIFGRNLTKFSRAQIDRGFIPEIMESYSAQAVNEIKQGRNPFYMPTIKEVLGDSFVIYEAQQKEKQLNREPVSDEQKLRIMAAMGLAQRRE